ncbi:MAG: hypothetical protein H6657_13830 [Ardenticatenaceae bacterium]|nr:hypothetical protein [Ardenticatenaceae bacterium]
MDPIREQFVEINGRLLSAKKAVRERDRILALMASLDESLVAEQEKLADLAIQLDEVKDRMADLEGLTWTAVWQKLIGNHEEELSEEAEQLAALKMAHEASEIRIQSIQNSLQEFEVALVDLAECDEELTAVQAEQQAFLVRNGRLPAKQIHRLNQQISEGQTFLREAAEAIAVGERALQVLIDLRTRITKANDYTGVTSPKPGHPVEFVRLRYSTKYRWGTPYEGYTGMGAIVIAAGEIQPLLDLFQLELLDIAYQMKPPPDLEVPDLGEVMLAMKSLLQDNGFERSQRVGVWREHLSTLDKRLQQKVDFLRNKIGHGETAVAHAQTELQTLIEQHWQEANRE